MFGISAFGELMFDGLPEDFSSLFSSGIDKLTIPAEIRSLSIASEDRLLAVPFED